MIPQKVKDMAIVIASKGQFLISSDTADANVMFLSQIEGTKYFSIAYQNETLEADGCFTLYPEKKEGQKVNLMMHIVSQSTPSGSTEYTSSSDQSNENHLSPITLKSLITMKERLSRDIDDVHLKMEQQKLAQDEAIMKN